VENNANSVVGLHSRLRQSQWIGSQCQSVLFHIESKSEVVSKLHCQVLNISYQGGVAMYSTLYRLQLHACRVCALSWRARASIVKHALQPAFNASVLRLEACVTVATNSVTTSYMCIKTMYIHYVEQLPLAELYITLILWRIRKHCLTYKWT